MMRDASVTLTWADGDYTFRLGWGEMVMLQEACDAGPYEVYERLKGTRWRVQDIAAVMRLGLIGGGVEPTKALALVRDYVEGRPPLENVPFARGILMIGIMGAPDGEQPGEARGEATGGASTTSPTENSE
ncbi:hypothetical protein XM25_07810 [Devosia sp. H5989]|nr:hypothetical protein XM25_07810 [Devosia sp. H5989]